MGLFGTRKLLLVLVVTAYIFSEKAGQTGSDSGGGLSSRGSDKNSNVSTWGWAWTSNGTVTTWGWGNSSGLNHSSGTGSTHNSHNYRAPSNHSSSTGYTSNYIAPLYHKREIVVTVWKNGFGYQEWASKNAPFYIDDVLVFKNNKDQPNQTQSKKHNNNVYLLPDLRSYGRCDVTRGKKLVTRGSLSSQGFKLLLSKTQPYYLVSGDNKSCSDNNMKFFLSPIPRPPSY